MSLPRIFVQIASYRDRECQWTLRDMFERAKHPERVFAGICWQVVPQEDDDCFTIRPYPEQVRSIEVHADQARGVGWARQQAQSLWQGEEYTLQIDSHMRFVDDWDERMIEMLAACPSDNPLLTVYPPAYLPPDERLDSGKVIVQFIRGFQVVGLPQFGVDMVPDDIKVDRPQATAAYAAGFAFSSSRVLEDVPVDPDIYFNGEEPSYALRLWTAGYDLFSPHETLIYHYYYRRDGSRHWNDAKPRDTNDLHLRTMRRVRLLTEPGGFRPDEVAELGRYGLGNKRSLAAYEAFSGINFAARTMAEYTRSYPWVRLPDAEVAQSLPSSLRTADGTELFVVDGEGVLFSMSNGTLHRFNEAASIVWCALEAGQDWHEIAEQSAAARGISVEAVMAELRELAAHWIGEGLIIDTAKPRKGAPRIDPAKFDFREHDYRLLDAVVRLRCGDAALEALTDSAFAHLDVSEDGVRPTATLTIVQILDWFYIFNGDQMLHIGDSARGIVPKLKAEVMRIGIEGQSHVLHLHSAALTYNNRLLLLPAASGSGKTVMTSRLVAHGCGYFSDEAVLLSRESGTIRPVPTALSVKAGAVTLLEPFYPGLSDLAEHDREDGLSVRYLPPPRGSLQRHGLRMRPELIVFPRYEKDAPTVLRRLSGADALGRLLSECVAIPRKLDTNAASLIVGTIEEAQCWELVSGDLETASREIMGLFERVPNAS